MFNLLETIQSELNKYVDSKTFKYEDPLESAQDGVVTVNGKKMVMLASNNYLGLANHPRIKKAAIDAIEKYGYGVASVRFICGTQTIHRQLEEKIAEFLKMEDAILFSSCFAANEALFAGLCNQPMGMDTWKDVIYSDRLNHASIIDGIRLVKSSIADKKVYEHLDLADLEAKLEADKNEDYRIKLIVTDGVFSMEGDVAPLDKLLDIANKHNAWLVVDDSHALGVIGNTGRGSSEVSNVLGKVHIITGTLGKAIGGAAGGFIASKKDVVTYLRQTARPYTFSNSLPPAIVMASMEAFNLLEEDNSQVQKLHENTRYFRKGIQELGFTILEGDHPIVPVMLGEAAVAQDMSKALLEEGVYIKGLWFPVVPKGEARLRAQISAALTKEDIDRALAAFEKVGKRMNVI
ncbi:MAG: glycine C-acetyltransferase [Calditrichia bacterium]